MQDSFDLLIPASPTTTRSDLFRALRIWRSRTRIVRASSTSPLSLTGTPPRCPRERPRDGTSVKEVTQGYAAPGGQRCLVVARWGVAVQTGRVFGETSWGNVFADRRETAGGEPFSARSPVVGKSDINYYPGTGAADRATAWSSGWISVAVLAGHHCGPEVSQQDDLAVRAGQRVALSARSRAR
jgi:hypothetical protein